MPTLEWIGKDKVINHHQEVPYRVLEHQYSFDKNGVHEENNNSDNMIIHGDNLEALKSLLPKYEGKVKCIYIDPPYNTGNEGWCYNDNVNDSKIKKWFGQVVGKEGEDMSRHDKWLCMMYPRLKILYKLLSLDGVLFISIDDNEQANLKLVCDEIYGTANFVDTVIWEKRYSPQNAAKWLSESHDFIMVYAKNKELWYPNLLKRTVEMNARYRNLDNDPRGSWKPTDATAQAGHGTETQFYELIAPNGKHHILPKGRCWVYTEPVMKQMIEENRIWFGKDGNNVPAIKRFLSDVKEGMACKTIWSYQEVGHNQEAKKEIKSIFPEEIPFDTPKPTRLIERIIQLATNKDSIVLDAFAGSGTTAHATLNMNKLDGGNRKYILIEMEDYANSITAERVKRVIDGYGDGKNAVEGIDGSFNFYELGKPLFLSNGDLNREIDIQKVREYIWYMETKKVIQETENTDNSYFLGKNNETAYYFYYDNEHVTTLDHKFLTTISTLAENYIIYADLCTISEKELQKHNITFKKVPRDITKL